jgi:Predicted transmembrane sensor domain
LPSLIDAFAVVLTLFNLESRDMFNPLRNFRSAELKSLDALFNVRGKRDLGKEIVVVMIDENGIKKLRRYPLPRDHVGKFVDTVADLGAKVLVFNVLYAEPQNEFHVKSIECIKNSCLALSKGKNEDVKDCVTLFEHEKMALGAGALVSDCIYAQAYLRSLE